ncbi:hypothetical protein [Hydrogenovibrio sp. SC-1]|uniref:hypothetical protein n=1 Tax=Hydrogenovibrio sp. SC-1 TaxID=2065820 RepID=UPI00117BC56C|nr:hypothetical protein [Hydrogenovibrio sp. SC-1]
MTDIATSFIGVLSEKSKSENKLHEREVKFKEKQLDHNQSVFKYKFWLMTGGLLSIVAIASGLIFYRDQADLGISILSHSAAIIGGVIAGVGYESAKSNK